MPCDHSISVEDTHEGTVVCTLCCRVLDQLYTYDSHSLTPFPESDIPTTGNAIRDICANFNIPNAIEQRCLEIYTEIAPSKIKRFPRNVLVAFSVYQGLMDHDVARSPQEILCMTGVELSRIFEVEKLLTNTSISAHPTSATYVERFGQQCGLSFPEIQHVMKFCEVADNICENYAPQTIAASLISCYCKLFKKCVSIQMISKICLVSSSSIYRITRLLTKQMIFTKINS